MRTTTAEPLHTDFLAQVLTRTEPALHAPRLADETPEETEARLVAAADITDDLIDSWKAEAASEVQAWSREAHAEVALMGAEAAVETEDSSAKVRAEVASWLCQIRGAAA